MKAPAFWRHDGVIPRLLQPLACLYQLGYRLRWKLARPARVAIPVICIGNAVVGGAGKTPVALWLAGQLAGRGVAVHILSRGHGGSLSGRQPLRVDPARHGAGEVGDEPLLLARLAPVWIGRDRAASARAALAAGAQLLLMDDGLQNPSLHKDISLLVIDGPAGMGNGRSLPAGPLREPLERAASRCRAAIVIGEDAQNMSARLTLPVYAAKLVPGAVEAFTGQKIIAFAGIGRPEKFFATLRQTGAELIDTKAFSDHHRYTDTELRELQAMANRQQAMLVTTEKDAVRLAPAWKARVRVVPIALQPEPAETLTEWLNAQLAALPGSGDKIP